MRQDFKLFDRPLKVLVVEDNPIDLRLIESMLSDVPQYFSKFTTTGTLTQAKEILLKDDYDVILLDLNLPDSAGIKTLHDLHAAFPDKTIVVNTGEYEDDLGIRTLSQGAQDFLVKGKYTAYILIKVLHYAAERKKLQDEIAEAYRQLQETQFHLMSSEKMKTVGTIASGIAHEVKNPLATILYGVSFLAEDLKEHTSGDISLVISNIKEAIERADRIISDLLDFSNFQRIEAQPEKINAILEKALTLVGHDVEKNGIYLEEQLGADLPLICVERNRIEQVIINLLLNAVHSISHNKRKGKIIISTRCVRQDSKDKVLLQIEDNGIGIPANNLDKIFEPFYSTRQNVHGLGLGLYVSKIIMDLHAGRIFFENLEKGGVRASLEFTAME